MNTIRYVDLLANLGQLQMKFENAFHLMGTDVECVLTSQVVADSIFVCKTSRGIKGALCEITEMKSEEFPAFDFLLTSFPKVVLNPDKDHFNTNHPMPIEILFTELERILNERKPYGFMIENIEGLLEFGPLAQIDNLNEKLKVIVTIFEEIGYKVSWNVLDSESLSMTESSKSVFIVGTLGSATVLSNIKKKNQRNVENQSNFMEMLFEHHGNIEELQEISGNKIDSPGELATVQKELLNLLVQENRKKYDPVELEKQEMPRLIPDENEKSEANHQVYFKLYPPKKLTQITKEDGSVTGLVHSFIFQEVFEETVKELDFARNLNSDLKALFTSTGEQIVVVDGEGKIIRISGTFFSAFWNVNHPDEIIGKSMTELNGKHIFKPDIFNLCKKKKDEVTAIQESGNRQIWSVATPVYENGLLERVVILSKEITYEDARVNSADSMPQSLEDPFAVSTSEDRQLIYRSEKIKNILTQISRVAKMNSTVLLEGETGVGKEVFAHKLYKKSARSHQPLIRINCGAIPEQLIESELFGYEKGSFTGADKNGKIGYFELAHQGTIFLDEIGELPFNMQVKLLRVLQEREVTRIGGTRPVSIDVRIIAATNQNLKELVDSGKFREDLYYRLNVVPFKIPSLRERREDIFPMAVFFLEQQKKLYGLDKSFDPEAIKVLETYNWPGNVRELQNIIERLLIFNDEEWIKREDVLVTLYGNVEAAKNNLTVFKLMPLKDAIEEVETQLITLGMAQYSTALELSKELGISPATLSRRMKKIKE